jgi:hypothetical protein
MAFGAAISACGGHPTATVECQDRRFRLSGQARTKTLSNMAMEMVLRRMRIKDATVHGFRSSFRDWAGNVSSFPRELVETALVARFN